MTSRPCTGRRSGSAWVCPGRGGGGWEPREPPGKPRHRSRHGVWVPPCRTHETWRSGSGGSPMRGEEAVQGGRGGGAAVAPAPPAASSRQWAQQPEAGATQLGKVLRTSSANSFAPRPAVVAPLPPCPVPHPPPPPSPQTFLFHFYGLILRECTCVDMVRRHLASLLELSHQSSGQREVGGSPRHPRPSAPPPARTSLLDGRWTPHPSHHDLVGLPRPPALCQATRGCGAGAAWR